MVLSKKGSAGGVGEQHGERSQDIHQHQVEKRAAVAAAKGGRTKSSS